MNSICSLASGSGSKSDVLKSTLTPVLTLVTEVAVIEVPGLSSNKSRWSSSTTSSTLLFPVPPGFDLSAIN